MKRLLPVLFTLFLSIACFGQEVEVSGSYNTSSEQRFQNGYGVGLQYQQDIIKRVKVGLGVHYNFNNASFDYIPYLDYSPTAMGIEKIYSSSKRFSVRLNAQYLLKDNEYVSLSIGPEISYNNLWGQDHIYGRIGDGVDSYHSSPQSYEYKHDNKLDGIFGAGLISKIEIKDFLTKQLALCFTIREESLLGNHIEYLGGSDAPLFNGWITATEFQLGLKYRFKK